MFFHYTNKNTQYHSAFIYLVERIDYEYEKFETKEVEFLGHKFLVPEDELKYITTKYGDSWNKSDPNWDWAFSPRNHKRTGIIIDTQKARSKFLDWINSQ